VQVVAKSVPVVTVAVVTVVAEIVAGVVSAEAADVVTHKIHETAN
jgi:hypothetical protein